jgi:hypothetical protein
VPAAFRLALCDGSFDEVVIYNCRDRRAVIVNDSAPLQKGKRRKEGKEKESTLILLKYGRSPYFPFSFRQYSPNSFHAAASALLSLEVQGAAMEIGQVDDLAVLEEEGRRAPVSIVLLQKSKII